MSANSDGQQGNTSSNQPDDSLINKALNTFDALNASLSEVLLKDFEETGSDVVVYQPPQPNVNSEAAALEHLKQKHGHEMRLILTESDNLRSKLDILLLHSKKIDAEVETERAIASTLQSKNQCLKKEIEVLNAARVADAKVAEKGSQSGAVQTLINDIKHLKACGQAIASDTSSYRSLLHSLQCEQKLTDKLRYQLHVKQMSLEYTQRELQFEQENSQTKAKEMDELHASLFQKQKENDKLQMELSQAAKDLEYVEKTAAFHAGQSKAHETARNALEESVCQSLVIIGRLEAKMMAINDDRAKAAIKAEEEAQRQAEEDRENQRVKSIRGANNQASTIVATQAADAGKRLTMTGGSRHSGRDSLLSTAFRELNPARAERSSGRGERDKDGGKEDESEQSKRRKLNINTDPLESTMTIDAPPRDCGGCNDPRSGIMVKCSQCRQSFHSKCLQQQNVDKKTKLCRRCYLEV